MKKVSAPRCNSFCFRQSSLYVRAPTNNNAGSGRVQVYRMQERRKDYQHCGFGWMRPRRRSRLSPACVPAMEKCTGKGKSDGEMERDDMLHYFYRNGYEARRRTIARYFVSSIVDSNANFVLLPFGKNEQMYDTIFGTMRDAIAAAGGALDLRIIVDFEKAAINAAKRAFPSASVEGCAFHLAQAWNRKRDALGLRSTETCRTEEAPEEGQGPSVPNQQGNASLQEGAPSRSEMDSNVDYHGVLSPDVALRHGESCLVGMSTGLGCTGQQWPIFL
ncbi:hypothetical protein OSTOST_10144 [Ostertagia ostertagi]